MNRRIAASHLFWVWCFSWPGLVWPGLAYHILCQSSCERLVVMCTTNSTEIEHYLLVATPVSRRESAAASHVRIGMVFNIDATSTPSVSSSVVHGREEEKGIGTTITSLVFTFRLKPEKEKKFVFSKKLSNFSRSNS